MTNLQRFRIIYRVSPLIEFLVFLLRIQLKESLSLQTPCIVDS